MQTVLDEIIEAALVTIDAEAVGNVVIDRFRERIGALENHTDAAAKVDDIERVNLLAIEKNFADDARVANRFVHAIERAQECGLAATGRADERSDFVLGNLKTQSEDGLLRTIKKVQVGDLETQRRLLCRSRRRHFGGANLRHKHRGPAFSWRGRSHVRRSGPIRGD